MSTTTNPKPLNTWTWRVLGAPPPPKKKMPRQKKALIQAPIMVGIAGLIHLWLDHVIMPGIIVFLAFLVLVGGLFYAPLFNGFERFGVKLTYWVTLILNWGLLTPFFYLVFLPGRIVLKLKGKDPMDRKFPDPRPSFWVERKPVTDLNQYTKQH
ncbi:MAG TPA: hypothetical protein PKE55_11525 [Kiritimatiellia bacterium]|nr:hypothetical protein [Kiritimatiellia bacterium]